MERRRATRSVLKWGAMLVAAAWVTLPRPASAQPATANTIQPSGGFQYGFDLDGQLNPWGPGLGLGVGYTLPAGVYLGARFEYFFGSKETSPDTDVSVNLWELFAEGGYDLGLGDAFVLRLKGDVGMASVNVTCTYKVATEAVCADVSGPKLSLGPGLTFLYLGKGFGFAVDTRYDIVVVDETLHGLIVSVGIGF